MSRARIPHFISCIFVGWQKSFVRSCKARLLATRDDAQLVLIRPILSVRQDFRGFSGNYAESYLHEAGNGGGGRCGRKAILVDMDMSWLRKSNYLELQWANLTAWI